VQYIYRYCTECTVLYTLRSGGTAHAEVSRSVEHAVQYCNGVFSSTCSSIVQDCAVCVLFFAFCLLQGYGQQGYGAAAGCVFQHLQYYCMRNFTVCAPFFILQGYGQQGYGAAAAPAATAAAAAPATGQSLAGLLQPTRLLQPIEYSFCTPLHVLQGGSSLPKTHCRKERVCTLGRRMCHFVTVSLCPVTSLLQARS